MWSHVVVVVLACTVFSAVAHNVCLPRKVGTPCPSAMPHASIVEAPVGVKDISVYAVTLLHHPDAGTQVAFDGTYGAFMDGRLNFLAGGASGAGASGLHLEMYQKEFRIDVSKMFYTHTDGYQYESSVTMTGNVWVVKHSYCCGDVGRVDTMLDSAFETTTLPTTGHNCPAGSPVTSGYNHAETALFGEVSVVGDANYLPVGTYQDALRDWTGCVGALSDFTFAKTSPHCFVESRGSCPLGYTRATSRVHVTSGEEIMRAVVRVHHESVFHITIASDVDMYAFLGWSWVVNDDYSELSFASSYGAMLPDVDIPLSTGGNRWGAGSFFAYFNYCCRRDVLAGTDCGGWGAPSFNKNGCECTNTVFGGVVHRAGTSCEVGVGDGQLDEDGFVTGNREDCETDTNAGGALLDLDSSTSLDLWNHNCNSHVGRLQQMQAVATFEAKGDGLRFSLDPTTPLLARIRLGTITKMRLDIRRADDEPMWEPFWSNAGGVVSPDTDADQSQGYDSGASTVLIRKTFKRFEIPSITTGSVLASGFPPLTDYKVRLVFGTVHSRATVEMNEIRWRSWWTTFSTTCGCDWGGTGAPASVLAKQSGKAIYFSWTDDSTCEERFNVYRTELAADGSLLATTTAFINAFAFSAADKCGSEYAPTSGADLVEELTLGTTYRYCMEAQTSAPRPFTSPQTCADLAVAWTGIVYGTVATKGGGGVRDTAVTIYHPLLNGGTPRVVTTNAQGEYFETLTIPGVSEPIIPIALNFSKTSNDVAHEYECSGVACTQIVVDVKHLAAGRAAPIDVSTISVEGTVTYADTAPWTGGANTIPGDANTFPRAPGPPCAVVDANVRVCAYDATSGNEVECVGVSPGGTGNPPGGAYRLTLPIGVTARVVVEWRAGEIIHTFAPGLHRVTAGANDVAGIDFEDTTTQELTVAVHASACKLYLGPTVLQAQMSVVCPNYVRDLYVGIAESDGASVTRLSPADIKLREGLQTGPSGDPAKFPLGFSTNLVANELLETTYALPAALIDVFPPSVEQARAISQRLADVVTYTGISEPNVPLYFASVGLTSQSADLRTGDKRVTYEYREPAVATITKWPGAQAIDCTGKTVPRPPVSTSPAYGEVYVLKEQNVYNVEAEVVETYAANIGSCTRVPGAASVLDTVSPNGPCAAAGAGPCAVEPVIGPKSAGSSSIVTKFSFPVLTQFPNPVSFYGTLTLSFIGASGMATVDTVVDLIVVGKKPKGEPYLVPMPPFQISALLHDPPGGASFAAFSRGSTSTSEVGVSDERSSGMTNSFSVSAGVGVDNEVCVGIGVTACGKTLALDISVGVTGAFSTTSTKASETTSGITLTSTEEYTTSDLPEALPGRPSDLVIAPVYVVKYTLAHIVSFDVQTCVASSVVDLTWLAAPKVSSKASALVVNTVRDIEEATIPTLNRLKLLTNPTDTVKLTALDEGIVGWTKLVADNDVRIAEAMPELPTDTVLFTGGGATLTRETSGETSSSYTASDSVVVTEEVGAAFSVEAQIFAVTVGASTDMSWPRETTTGSSAGSTFETSTTSSFTLVDPDPGDSIEVVVATDPVFGTPIFRTTGGMTKCPAEAGTNARETFDFVPIGSTNLVDLAPDGEGLLELELRNLSPAEESIFVQIEEVSGSNVEGLRFDFNGDTFATGRAVEIPYLKHPNGTAIVGGQSVNMVVAVSRGPRAYEYNDVVLRVSSICEYGLQIYNLDKTVAVSAEFLEPCASIDWAGELRIQGSWAVNAERVVDVDTLRGFVKNPEFSSSRWASHRRVETVTLEYKFAGDVTWRPARQADTATIQMVRDPATAANAVTAASTLLEDPFGFAVFAWDLANFADGAYDVRGYVRCTPKFGGSELDYGVSTAISGVLDRVKPELFGRAQPADGEYFPGDLVQFTFDEDINCKKPFVFQLALQMDGVSYTMANVPVKCSGDTISLDVENVKGAPAIETLGGATVVMSVANVRDVAGNIMADAVAHSFTIFQITPALSSANVADVHYGVAYADANADRVAFANLLITEVEAANVADPALGAGAAGRVVVSDIKPTKALQTSVTFFITPGTAPTALAIATAMTARITTAAAGTASDASEIGSAEWRAGVAERSVAKLRAPAVRALPASISATTLPTSAPSAKAVPATSDALVNTAKSSTKNTELAAGNQSGVAAAPNVTSCMCTTQAGGTLAVSSATPTAASSAHDDVDETRIIVVVATGFVTVLLALVVLAFVLLRRMPRAPVVDKDAAAWSEMEASAFSEPTVLVAADRYVVASRAAPAPSSSSLLVTDSSTDSSSGSASSASCSASSASSASSAGSADSAGSSSMEAMSDFQ